jgi:tripartite-type tricarboxylate transporter receptor subunit TctC
MLKKISLIAVLATIAASGIARADYPERAITFIVPYGVGGGSDRTARALIPYLEKYLGEGTKIAVVNKPGAGGSVAWAGMATAKPDGYTIGMVNLPDAVTGPMLNPDVGYKVDSFVYIGAINKEPTTITVKADSPIKDLAGFIAAAKAKPGKVTVGVPSLSNVHSVGATKFAAEVGIEINKIPLKGGGPTMNALLGGHIESAALSVGAASKKKDKVRILVQMATERAPTAPNVPTTVELGYKSTNYVIRSFAAPKGTPAAVLTKLRGAFKKAMDDAAFRKAAAKQRIAVVYMSGEELVATADELDKSLSKLWKTNPWMSKKK